MITVIGFQKAAATQASKQYACHMTDQLTKRSRGRVCWYISVGVPPVCILAAVLAAQPCSTCGLLGLHWRLPNVIAYTKSQAGQNRRTKHLGTRHSAEDSLHTFLSVRYILQRHRAPKAQRNHFEIAPRAYFIISGLRVLSSVADIATDTDDFSSILFRHLSPSTSFIICNSSLTIALPLHHHHIGL